MRPWRYVGANPQSWWCVVPNCTSDFSNPVATAMVEMRDAKAAGAAWVRVEVPWPLIEPSSGVWDWSRMDALMQASQTAGEPILPILSWTPPWAGGGTALNQPATNVSDWTTFVTNLVQRYGSRFPAVDVWNEPDGGHYLFNGSAQTYVASILNPAYSAIKAVAPALAVIEAGSANDAGSCCPFISAVLADGGKFDIASFHNYAGTWGAEASSYRSILNSAGRSATPIWMTEFGVQSSLGDQSAALQQVFGGSVALQAAAWYNLRDTDAWTCCPPAVASTATWGLLDGSFNAKPSWTTFENLLTGRSSPPPPPNLSSLGAAPGSSASSASGTGPPGQPTEQGPGGPPTAPSPQGPRSPLENDPAFRDRILRDVDPASLVAPAAKPVALTPASGTWLHLGLIAGAVAATAVAALAAWLALRRRGRPQPHQD